MHQRRLSELQGADCPCSGTRMWAWFLMCILLVALVDPGACSFLSEENQELLVELHNYYRGQVSPSASAMLPLKWDPNLMVLAQNYAIKCIWSHNSALEETGENLHASNGDLELEAAVEKWFLEHLNYNYQNNSCNEDRMCGHYTQMVWADTHRVGCAYHLCNTIDGLNWEKVNFLVCNYFPAGNYEDERPFVEGDSCSSCPEKLLRCANNLCVPDIEEAEETASFSDPPPKFSPASTNEGIIEIPAASTSRVPSIITTVPTAEATPPPGTAEQDIVFSDAPSPSSKKEQEDEFRLEQEEDQKEKSIIRKQETPNKSFPQSKISAGSVCTASVLLACGFGLLTVWL